MYNLRKLLEEADAKGIDDRQIAKITGRNYTTVWRWRQKPDTAFLYDDGIGRLAAVLEGGNGDNSSNN